MKPPVEKISSSSAFLNSTLCVTNDDRTAMRSKDRNGNLTVDKKNCIILTVFSGFAKVFLYQRVSDMQSRSLQCNHLNIFHY